MPTVLTGSAADPTTSPQATGPASGDAIAAGPMDSPLQSLLNFVAWLRTHAAWADQSNTFTQAQTLQALLTLSAAAAASLSRSGDQTILKSGSGKLQLGTSIASDLELLVNGAVALAIVNGVGIDAKGNELRSIASSATGTSAARVDQVVLPGYTSIVGDTGWVAGVVPPVAVKAASGIVYLKGQIQANVASPPNYLTTVAAGHGLPSNCAATNARLFPVIKGLGGVTTFQTVSLTGRDLYLNVTPQNGDIVYLDGISYPVA